MPPTAWKDKTPEQRAAAREATARWRLRNGEASRAESLKRRRALTPEEKAAVNARRRERRLECKKNPALAQYLRDYAKQHYERHGRDYQRRRNGLPVPTRPCPAVCELCGSPPGPKVLALDHDHASGVFRGWLCDRCNRGLGFLGDCREMLLAALAYLDRKPD